MIIYHFEMVKKKKKSRIIKEFNERNERKTKLVISLETQYELSSVQMK